jgi:hypothetical protein
MHATVVATTIEIDRYLQQAVDEGLIEPALDRLIDAYEALPDAFQLTQSSFLEGRKRPFKTQIVNGTLYVAAEIPAAPNLFQSRRAQEMLRWLNQPNAPDLSPLEKAATVPPALREQAKNFVPAAAFELLRSIFMAADLKGAALSLYEARTPRRMGQHFALTCIMSVEVSRAAWERAANQARPPEEILRTFSLDFDYSADFSVQPVEPKMPPGQGDRFNFRGLPLWDLDLNELESLVRELLTRLGFVVRRSTQTRDKGVDIIAIVPPRTAREHFFIQVKSYLTNVGAPAMRELREKIDPPKITGAVMMTTSKYSEDALKIARGRPIQLITGAHLKQLLIDYGLTWTERPVNRL